MEKLLALQRDIDEQSQPTQPAKPLTSHMISAEAKMEGENGEANIIKKEKKQKRGQIFSAETQICAAENGSQAKIKKKGKTVEAVAKEKEDETNQKKDKKKKRKKHNDLSSTVESDDDEKKKKSIECSVNQVETVTLKTEKLEKKKRKEEKFKDKCVQIKPEIMKVEEDEEMQIGSNNRKKPKKEKGKGLVSRTPETKEVVVEKKTPVITDGVGGTKAKKKSKVLENGTKVEKEETEASEAKLKRKKEESKSEEFGNEIKAERKRSTEDDKILSKKKNKEIALEEDLSEVKIKRKKKNKKAKEEDGKVEAEEMEPQKKKKRRIKENEDVEDSITLVPEPQSKKNKKKKNSTKDDQDMNTETKATGKKKKKNEDSQDFSKGDVVFLSAKTGNSDEVAINQERRKALQMEIEEASQSQKPDKLGALGQWSTAQFDSSQQQQKFLRLMGGFKKGFQPAGAAAGGANMALGKDAQQHLQQGLLGEFERAHARKMDFSNRGAGLGFTAPSNKKFSININASRSVRFDD